ncbi:MAG: response regulator [Candidatus Methylomirabilia bacterium]
MKGTILVVDDEEDICQLFLRSLALEGFEVAAVGSGPEALAVVDREPPDLIILDLALPGMDGIETLRRIRERGVDSKVLILTAYGTAQRAREALALGAREFVSKPFDLHRLLRLLIEEAGEAAMRKELMA